SPTARRAPAARHDVPAPPRHARAALPLDVEAISRTAQESEAVSALLGDLLTDDAGSMPPSPAPSALPDGLDAAHAALLRDLLRQESWTAVEAASLAATHHLLLAGAIDTINEWALEQIDEPLVEGDDPLQVAHEAAQALIGA
ncbi:MAG: tellurite resistance TerB C-terminal domain-containing protein, partial [Thermomicrobiales bacterium]